jgi:hypothetical protein
MPLPDSRNTTYAAGVSQVKSADLNDLQDKIIAKSHGEVDYWLAAEDAQLDGNVTFEHPAVGDEPYIRMAVAGGQVTFGLGGIAPAGSVITEVELFGENDGAQSTTNAAFAAYTAGGFIQAAIASQANGDFSVLMDGGGGGSQFPHTVVASRAGRIWLTAYDSAGLNNPVNIYGVRVRVRKP